MPSRQGGTPWSRDSVVDRIDDQRDSPPRSPLGHGRDHVGPPQRAGLHRRRWDVGDHRVELLDHELRIEHLDRRYLPRVLHRHERDDAHAVNAVLVKGLEVGLQSRTARWIGAGDGEGNGAGGPLVGHFSGIPHGLRRKQGTTGRALGSGEARLR